MRYLIVFLLFATQLSAGPWKYHYSAGTSLYQGDFSRFKTIHPNLLGGHFGIGLGKEVNDNFDFGLNVFRSSMLADEAINGYGTRSYSSTGSVYSGGLNVKYFKKRNTYTRVLSFLSLDAQYLFSNSTLNRNSEEVEGGKPSLVSKSDQAFSLGLGIGLGYRINGKYSILWETKGFMTTTDYLDAFDSGTGNGANDSYVVSYLTLVYRPSKFFIKSKKERGYQSPRLRKLGCRKH